MVVRTSLAGHMQSAPPCTGSDLVVQGQGRPPGDVLTALVADWAWRLLGTELAM